MIRIFLLAVLLLGTSVFTSAQHQKHGKRGKGASTELRAELRSWFEQQVAPSLREWQRQFDATLSQQELETVRRMRIQASALRKNRGANHHDAKEAIAAELKPIMKQHRDYLRGLFDRNEEAIEAWRDQARAIANKHSTDAGDSRRGKHGVQQLPLIGGDGKRAAIRFVLWDGTLPPVGEAFLDRSTGIDESNMVLPDGAVAIEVFDMNGSLVRTQQGTMLNGELQESINVNGLAKGQYMASIKAGNGKRTSRIVQH